MKEQKTLSLPGLWETNSAVANSLVRMVSYNLADNYYDTYADKIKNLTTQEIIKEAKRVIKPKSLIWVVVGDKSKFEDGIKNLGLPIKYIDTDGNVIQ